MRSLFFEDFQADLLAEVKDSTFEHYYAGTHRNMAWATLAPYEEAALREYILPHIGGLFFDAMVADPGQGNDRNPTHLKVIDLIRYPLAYYLIYDALPDQNVKLTDLGAQQISDSGGTTSNPSQWAYKEKRWNLMRKADQMLDQLLQALATYSRSAEQTQRIAVQMWTEDQERKRETAAFFSKPAELDRYLNMRGSRRAYATVIPYFRKAERRYIKPVLGAQFFEQLSDHYREPSAEAPFLDEALLLVQECLAEYGLMEALPHLSCVIDGETIVVVSKRDGFDNRGKEGIHTSIARLRQSAEEQGATALKSLQAFLRKNADQLPTYRDGEAYPSAISSNDTVIADPDGGSVFL